MKTNPLSYILIKIIPLVVNRMHIPIMASLFKTMQMWDPLGLGSSLIPTILTA
jgi:hypothetical protein